MPNALLEAFAVGLPAVARDVEGVAETLGADAASQMVAGDNPFAASAKITALVADPALRRRLGDANRQRMSERFSPSAIVDRYAELYSSLCEG
jgi:glycosyltransferase involved in cell wall biosynthesis